LVSGLWHGAAWRFLVWGGINGLAAAVPTGTPGGNHQADVPGGDANLPRPATLLRMAVTFAVICAAWLFFRAETFADATSILYRIAADMLSGQGYRALVDSFDQDRFLRTTAILLLLFVLWEWLQRRQECPLSMDRLPVPMRWATYTAMFWLTIYWMPQTAGQEFIYFEF
jgi:hypothetical protein